MRIIQDIIIAIVACAMIAVTYVDACPDYFSEPQIIRATCYTGDGVTKSGQEVRYGIIAGKEEWLGCVACMYAVNEDGSIGDFIGYFECLDTGSADWLNDGTAIDVYQESLDDCYDWVAEYGDYVYIKLVKGVG